MFGRKVELPRFVETPTQLEAIYRLLYLIDSSARFAFVEGSSGSGKTTVLLQIKENLQRKQFFCPFVNVSGMDCEALLWQIACAFSLDASSQRNRAELLLAIRDELQGRVQCGQRTVILLDDIDFGFSDIDMAIRFLIAAAGQGEGLVTVVMTGSQAIATAFTRDSELSVPLPPLTEQESMSFIGESLTLESARANTTTDQVVCQSAVSVIAEIAKGNLAKLSQLCHMLRVVHETSPTMKINDKVVREVADELLPRAVA